MSESWIELKKQMEQKRKENLQKIMELAKKLCPVDYAKLVHAIFIELGINYYQNQKRGVYSKELDSLIGVGKLKLMGDETVVVE